MGTILALLLMSAPKGHVVLVTIDGLRPVDVFTGADERILSRMPEGVTGLKTYGDADPQARRKRLMPFVWGTMASQGQLFGNTARGSPMRVKNEIRVSYPGYAEMLTGVADRRIWSNSAGPNPNVTVFEWLAQRPGFDGQVRAFGTWWTFNDIFNVGRSKLDLRCGWEPPFARDAHRTTEKDAVDATYRTAERPFGNNALDAPMVRAVMESLNEHRPAVLFVGFGEVDEWMHAGRYDRALDAAHRSDAAIATLWEALQTWPETKGRTTLVVTTDHGRGLGWEDWRHHGQDIAGSEQTWLAVMGPGVAPLGERQHTGLVTSAQVAATLAHAVGEDWSQLRSDAAPALVLTAPSATVAGAAP